jgi:DNA replication and repair protein RecF
MLEKIKIINFKWLKNKEFFFDKNFNVIVWNNWTWKTNTLEAISTLFLNNFYSNTDKDLVLKWENLFYLEWDFSLDWIKNTIVFSYDLQTNKKNIFLNKKKVTKKILMQNILKVSSFLPITMNLFYLWPKYRRDFLDNILINSFDEYDALLKEYEKILKTRNKILKNIQEWNSKKEEIHFWDEKFVILALKIIKYRIDLVSYVKENLKSNTEIFWIKVEKIDFNYITKVDLENIENSIKNYLEKNLERDIIIWKTHIWPHIDDFEILLDWVNLTNYASRWETKSIIICLKLLELSYIEKNTSKKPIFLIDDLTSELDEIHLKILLKKLEGIQTIITSILDINGLDNNLFINYKN